MSEAQLPIQVWGYSDRGRVRPINEDSFYYPAKQTAFPVAEAKLRKKGYLLIVADGIGGAAAGQEASRHVVSALRSAYYESPPDDPLQNLAAAVTYANDSLYQMRTRNPVLRDAGSTVVAGVIQDNKVYLANVGDSRAYLIRGGQAFQSTKDHTVVQEKTEQGIPVTESDKSVITRSMGAAATVQVDLYPPIPLSNGDSVLLCSDGLSDLATPDEIGQVVSSNSPRKAVQKLIKQANNRGGHDNITAIVATVGQLTTSPRKPLTGRQIAILAALFVLGVLIVAAVGIALLQSRQRVMTTPTLQATAPVGTAMPVSTATTATPVATRANSTAVPTVSPVATATKPVSARTTTASASPTTGGPSPTPCPYNKEPKGGECVCPEGTFWSDRDNWCVDIGNGKSCPSGQHRDGTKCVPDR